MINGPKLSIITACYNAERTIEQTIQSVLIQTYSNIEYVIVDGASTDGTMDIVRKYEDQINVVISEPDKGIYDAFNKGISACKGEVIYFLNADDVLFDEQVIEDVVAEFKLKENAYVIYGNVEYIDSVNGKIHFVQRTFNLDTIKQGLMPHHQGTFFSKDAFRDYGLYSLEYKLAADFEFTTRYYKQGLDRIHYFNRNIAKFRDGGLSTTVSYNKKSWVDETNEIVYKVFNVKITDAHFKNNIKLFKMWLELSLKDKSIISQFSEKDNIAIFGSGDVAIYLIKEFNQCGMKPKIILDNAKYKQGRELNHIKICSPEKLPTYDINVVILTAEADYDAELREQLQSIGTNMDQLPFIVSWKELVINTYGQLYS